MIFGGTESLAKFQSRQRQSCVLAWPYFCSCFSLPVAPFLAPSPLKQQSPLLLHLTWFSSLLKYSCPQINFPTLPPPTPNYNFLFFSAIHPIWLFSRQVHANCMKDVHTKCEEIMNQPQGKKRRLLIKTIISNCVCPYWTPTGGVYEAVFLKGKDF